jgi:hypothetical protein
MPSNAFLTTAAIGNREDLIDMIYNVSPTDTPLISMMDKVEATATTHEWQRDTLDTPAANAVAEGADATYTAVTPTQRLSNQTQIARKTFSVSDTQEKVRKAGRKSEIRYQTVKNGKALRKDMELALIENPTLTTGATRVARGVRGWLQTNNSLGVDGVAPVAVGGNTAPTNGTLRTFTEAILRDGVRLAYLAGGNPDVLMLHPTIKQNAGAAFTGNGTRFVTIADKRMESTFDFYEHDFGTLKIVPNRVMSRTREGYILDPEMMALAVLRDMETTELARIGSAQNYMMEAEFTLEMREERAHAALRDLQ